MSYFNIHYQIWRPNPLIGDIDEDCGGMELTGIAGMGNGTQTFGYLSQQSECLENMVREHNKAVVSNHDELFHKFRSLVESVRTYDQYVDQFLSEEHCGWWWVWETW